MRPLIPELLVTPKAVPEARRTVREHIGGPCAGLQLCVSELLANVIRRVGAGVPVTVRIAGAGQGGRTAGGHRPRPAVLARPVPGRLAYDHSASPWCRPWPVRMTLRYAPSPL